MPENSQCDREKIVLKDLTFAERYAVEYGNCNHGPWFRVMKHMQLKTMRLLLAIVSHKVNDVKRSLRTSVRNWVCIYDSVYGGRNLSLSAPTVGAYLFTGN